MRNVKSATKAAIVAMTMLLVAQAGAQENAANNLPPDVVARQGGYDLTIQDLDAYAHKIPDKDRAGFFDSPQRIENAILGLLLQRQLAGQARAAKLDQDADVQRQMSMAGEDTLARVYLEHYRKDMKLPNFETLAKEYYKVHQDEFGKPPARQSFEEVRDTLIKKLRDGYISQQVDQLTGDMRNKALDANPDLVASLRTRYLPPGAKLPQDEAEAARHGAQKKPADKNGGTKP